MNDLSVSYIVQVVVGVIILTAGLIGVMLGVPARGKKVLHEWAAKNGFEILKFERIIPLNPGLFRLWTTNRNQVVYHVHVRDLAGRERSGWVRCGGHYVGVLFSSETEVKWDDTSD